MNKQNEECNICNKWIGACTCATNAGHSAQISFKSGTFNDDNLLSSEQALKDQVQSLDCANDLMHDKNERLQEQLKQAVKVLKWYANEENHKWQEDENDVFSPPWTNMLNDKGKRARDFLSQGTEELK